MGVTERPTKIFAHQVNRVPNRFGGMRDLAFFRGDIWGLSRKKGWEVGISVASGSGISCFYRVGMRDWEGNRAGYGISIPA